ncbi:hypothetical protein GCM10011391_07120 [Pullulanibacillus camelliae]|uniref:Uncharacterized protein n=1 Tax=Pullulanibacillus camelliae TaxID=1707096 RepID=A0A8J2VLX2_9BACL|nr:hypothetical protein GCM10011391_07120 [Pullulanibacillus camelliae]
MSLSTLLYIHDQRTDNNRNNYPYYEVYKETWHEKIYRWFVDPARFSCPFQ